MNREKLVTRYAPDLYSNNSDMLAIYNAQSNEISRIKVSIKTEYLNNFVKTCNLDGIRRWEKIFNILADEINDTIEFRHARILNKIIQQPPYTKIYLSQMLDGLFGEDKYTLQVEENNYIIKIDIETEINGLFDDTIENIKLLIPANMILKVIQVEKYMHMYLKRHYTHLELEQFTYGELSQYSEVIE